ncbi:MULTISPECIES: hypothetical protein [unclassified Streptomyces]|uniref:hypothetical protein n=1 Tax=unclassified Streptomyces TaxID=2593676 RepID=UPI002E1E548C|nr:hypothetical protein OG217_37620 [Streptomyces sp. NBC_01023]
MARPPRVRADSTTPPPADPPTDVSAPAAPEPPPSFDVQRQHPTRPAIRRGGRRRRPVVASDPAAKPTAVLDHVRRVCETVLPADGTSRLMADFDDHYDESGACVFACQLYILNRRDSALYWRRFAAGAGHPLSAHLLAAYHAGAGTLSDARIWHAFAQFLGYASDQHLPWPVSLAAEQSPGITQEIPDSNELRTFMARDHLPKELLPTAFASR